MLDGNEIEVKKRLSTTPLHTLFADNTFFRCKSDFERNKKRICNVKTTKGKHGWKFSLHAITTEPRPNK